MITGIGIDIVSIKRIQESYNENFINHVLTSFEKEILNQKIGHKKIEYLAGRFAAKEAVMKALPIIPAMTDIEIRNDETGKPWAFYKQNKIMVSISHEKEQAIAMAIYQKENL